MALPEISYRRGVYHTNGGKEIRFAYECANREGDKPHVTIYDDYAHYPGTPDYLAEIATQVIKGTGMGLDEVTWTLRTKCYDAKSDISFSCIDGKPYKVRVANPSAIGMPYKEDAPVTTYLIHDDRPWMGKKEYLPCLTLFNNAAQSHVLLVNASKVLHDTGEDIMRPLHQEWKSRTSLHSPFSVGAWGIRDGQVAMISPKEIVLRVLASTQTPFFPMSIYGDAPATFEILRKQYGYGYNADGTGPDMSFK